MKRQQLIIRVIDLRKSEDHPQRERSKRYANHTDYLRDIARIVKADAEVSEQTETTITLYPTDTNPSLFT